MPSQIFKTTPPLDLLFNFLNTICENNGKKYTYNKVAYKKSHFLNTIYIIIGLIYIVEKVA